MVLIPHCKLYSSIPAPKKKHEHVLSRHLIHNVNIYFSTLHNLYSWQWAVFHNCSPRTSQSSSVTSTPNDLFPTNTNRCHQFMSVWGIDSLLTNKLATHNKSKNVTALSLPVEEKGWIDMRWAYGLQEAHKRKRENLSLGMVQSFWNSFVFNTILCRSQGHQSYRQINIHKKYKQRSLVRVAWVMCDHKCVLSSWRIAE